MASCCNAEEGHLVLPQRDDGDDDRSEIRVVVRRSQREDVAQRVRWVRSIIRHVLVLI